MKRTERNERVMEQLLLDLADRRRTDARRSRCETSGASQACWSAGARSLAAAVDARLAARLRQAHDRRPPEPAGGSLVYSSREPCQSPRYAVPAVGAARPPTAPDVSGRRVRVLLRESFVVLPREADRQRVAVRSTVRLLAWFERVRTAVAREAGHHPDPLP